MILDDHLFLLPYTFVPHFYSYYVLFSGDVSQAVHHARTISKQIKIAKAMDSTEIYNYAKELRVPVELLKKTAELGRLPVVNFAAGGLGIQACYPT